MKDNAILFFVKIPTPGKVKTRLAKTIGEKEAADIYRQLAQDNFNVLRNCDAADLIVVFDPPEDVSKVSGWLLDADQYIPQQGTDLGGRLICAFQWAFNQGYRKVAVFGSDTLELTTNIAAQSFVALKTADVVIGPAKDGGYYLIGTTALIEEIFYEIHWSTEKVLAQTYKKIEDLKLKYLTLSTLEDLDEIKHGGVHEFISRQLEKRRS